MKCEAALSTVRNSDAAFSSVVSRVAGAPGDGPADLAVFFASAHHADAMERFARELRERGVARHVLGCTGESIVGDAVEVEEAPALSLWVAWLPGVILDVHRLVAQDPRLPAVPPDSPGTGRPEVLILLGDPF